MTTEREAVCRAICKSGRFETGEGTCAVLCMEALGSARRGCGHVERIHGKMADAILAALAALRPASTGAGGELNRHAAFNAIAAWHNRICAKLSGDELTDLLTVISGLAAMTTPSPPGCPIPGAGVDAVAEAERALIERIEAYLSCEGDPVGPCIRMGIATVAWYKARALAADAQKGGAARIRDEAKQPTLADLRAAVTTAAMAWWRDKSRGGVDGDASSSNALGGACTALSVAATRIIDGVQKGNRDD